MPIKIAVCAIYILKRNGKKNTTRARLHPDAIPTFFGSSCDKENTIDMEINDEVERNGNIYVDEEPANRTQEKNSNMKSAETLQKHVEKHIEIEVEAETNENIYVDGEPANITQEKNSKMEKICRNTTNY